jgi:cytochrome b561
MTEAFGISPQAPAYTPVARTLHWLTAAMVLTIVPVGVAMVNIEGPWQNTLFHVHRSLGVLLIPVVLFRLWYRMSHMPAPLPADIPAVQRSVANAVHHLLYVLLIIQPIIGWIATSAYRAPIMFFGLFEVPPIWPENRAFSEQLFTVHKGIALVLFLLLCAHIGGALYHHFIRRDRVLMRMVTGG